MSVIKQNIKTINNLNNKAISFFSNPYVKYGFLFFVTIRIIFINKIQTSYLELLNYNTVKIIYALLVAYSSCFDPIYAIALATYIIISIQELHMRNASKNITQYSINDNNNESYINDSKIQELATDNNNVNNDNNVNESHINDSKIQELATDNNNNNDNNVNNVNNENNDNNDNNDNNTNIKKNIILNEKQSDILNSTHPTSIFIDEIVGFNKSKNANNNINIYMKYHSLGEMPKTNNINMSNMPNIFNQINKHTLQRIPDKNDTLILNNDLL